MNDNAIISNAILPAPKFPISVRPATLEDFPFIDALQTKHAKQLGYMPRAQMESKIKAGHVLVACSEPRASARGSGDAGDSAEPVADCVPEPLPEPLPYGRGSELGFIMGTDRYFKREDCGIIYQLCVEEGARRGLVGAMLVKAMFDRAAYGCRLFCCWCAQDIEANKFWESLGFVPLAYRAGSAKKSRVHIFWQKRIRAGDESTPWWFPSQTTGGSIRQDRIVLPIPPGTHWSDAKPIVLPVEDADPEPQHCAPPANALAIAPGAPGLTSSSPADQGRKIIKWIDPIAHLSAKERRKLPVNITSGLRAMVPVYEPVKEKKPAPKNDPKLIALARELRDRWLENVERNPSLLLPAGKYDVVRELPEAVPVRIIPAEPRLLAA